MACFIVPGTEAIVTTAITKIVEKKEKKEICSCETEGAVEAVKEDKALPFSRKLKWLNNMLWGGTALLAFEHVWHGEVTPFFPFLTAAGNPDDAVQMLHEMATAGVGMAVPDHRPPLTGSIITRHYCSTGLPAGSKVICAGLSLIFGIAISAAAF